MFELPQANHIYDKQGNRQTLEQLLNGENRHIWNKANSNEFGRLEQGNKYRVKSTGTVDFIYPHEVPERKKVTHAVFVCDNWPLRPKPYCIRIVVGKDKLPYDFDAGLPAASLIETKLLINSLISEARKGACFFSTDVRDFFLPRKSFIPNS